MAAAILDSLDAYLGCWQRVLYRPSYGIFCGAKFGWNWFTIVSIKWKFHYFARFIGLKTTNLCPQIRDLWWPITKLVFSRHMYGSRGSRHAVTSALGLGLGPTGRVPSSFCPSGAVLFGNERVLSTNSWLDRHAVWTLGRVGPSNNYQNRVHNRAIWQIPLNVRGRYEWVCHREWRRGLSPKYFRISRYRFIYAQSCENHRPGLYEIQRLQRIS